MARNPDAPPPQLYLVTPLLAEGETFAPRLQAALAGGQVAALRMRLATRDPNAAKRILKELAPLAQQAGAAVVLDDDTTLAARAGLDGAHINHFGSPLSEALDALKPDRIVGIGGLETRDDCMSAGEMDVDYLMFGGPDDPLDADAIAERAQWWAEIFNTPCVAYATDIGQTTRLVETGAEFIAFGDAVWAHPQGPQAAVEDIYRQFATSGAKA
jgi:thiamine-phosphate pyrophosphorylase